MNNRWNVRVVEPHFSLNIELIATKPRNHTLGYTLGKWT
jgi:hypothetical protein